MHNYAPPKMDYRSLRIGNGYDVHAFTSGRPLMLGGVKIDYPLGLAGHSDADVVVHALADALLSAAHLPDIGECFPPSDPAYKDCDSLQLLKQVGELLDTNHWRIIDTDITIIAQEPKLAAYKQAMKEALARALSIMPHQIGIKATTTEGLGFVGKKEGIAALANVLVQYV